MADRDTEAIREALHRWGKVLEPEETAVWDAAAAALDWLIADNQRLREQGLTGATTNATRQAERAVAAERERDELAKRWRDAWAGKLDGDLAKAKRERDEARAARKQFKRDNGVLANANLELRKRVTAAAAELAAVHAERDRLREEIRIREESQIPVIPRAAAEKMAALEERLQRAVEYDGERGTMCGAVVIGFSQRCDLGRGHSGHCGFKMWFPAPSGVPAAAEPANVAASDPGIGGSGATGATTAAGANHEDAAPGLKTDASPGSLGAAVPAGTGLEEALRFWVERADRFEKHLPADRGYMKARGVLHPSYAVGRAAVPVETPPPPRTDEPPLVAHRPAAECAGGKIPVEDKSDCERGLPRAADTGASGPALTPDEGQPETPQGVAWSHPSRGITGDLGGPLSESDLRADSGGSTAGSATEDPSVSVVALLTKAREALRGLANAYGCFAGCTGALSGAPADGSGHTVACRAARALLVELPPPTESEQR